MIYSETTFEYLKTHMGEARTVTVGDYLIEHKCSFRLSKPRISKRGDFRIQGKKRQISVNRDVNQYRFIITLIHELAHLKTYSEHRNRVKPHGREWKVNHVFLLRQFNIETIFSENHELIWLFQQEIENPKACSGVNVEQERILCKYDQTESEHFLEDLPLGSAFLFRNKEYQKLANRRSRVLCMYVLNRKQYTIPKASKVVPL